MRDNERHREIDCPVCPGGLCELDGDVRETPAPELVFILRYEHKYGADVSAYRTHVGAVGAAYELACKRVQENRWEDDGQRERFESFKDPEEALAFFHWMEREWSYSESLEITESVLGP